jgi:hypothetical protein
VKLNVLKGKTSKLVEVFISDSSSTTGAGLTGLVFNSAGLTWYYYRSGAASATAVTLATMTVGTWATGGFKEIDATNLPGFYQLGIPDAALVAGASQVVMLLKGATNMAPLPLEVQLVNQDPDDEIILKATTHSGAIIPTVTTLTNDAGITQAGADKVWNTAIGAKTVTVTTNNDKTGYGLSSAERDSTADAVLARPLGNGASALDARTVENALRTIRNKWAIAAGTLTVYEEDDATIAYTAAVTTTAGNPVTTVDPT